MENNKTQPKEKEECGESSSEETVKPLLSQRDIRSIIKDFAIAYIEGRTKIAFPTAEELMVNAKKKGQQLDYATAWKEEVAIEIEFDNNIHICLGTKKATPDELQQAICELFDDILSFRNSGRICGVFTQYSIENRIKELEEGLDKVNNLVEEMVEWITGLPPDKGASNDKPVP